MMPSLLLPFAGHRPSFADEPVFAGPRSAVIGRATFGAGAWLGADCVVRADGEAIRIGADVSLGNRSTVHIVHETTPAIIGDDVTVGANAIIHACTIGDGCVIERDVTVLDDAVVAPGVLIEAGATIFPRKRLEAGWIYAGSPAKPVRALRPGELRKRAVALRLQAAGDHTADPAANNAADLLGGHGLGPLDLGPNVFTALTARCAGRVAFAPGSSLFFSCRADAGTGAISVGADTCVQDNSILRAGAGELVIGREVTVGHNVRMADVRIGARSLIGMGAVLAAGTLVRDDVLLAAGSTTEPGQVLESGWMWGGRPARPISRLDEPRRVGMAQNIVTYCDYARQFRDAQAGLTG